MQKCALGPTPTWMTRSRSTGKALTLQFLSEYSASVYADYLYAIKLTKVRSYKERKDLGHPRPETDAMSKVRAEEPNVVMPIQVWINQSNDMSKDGSACHNYLKHKSMYFNNEVEWRDHLKECFAGETMPNIRSHVRS